MSLKFEILQQRIIELSVAHDFDAARLEWHLERVAYSHNETCACTHYPISELCHLRNELNDAELMVGNCCVKRFRDEELDAVFDAIRRIMADDTRPMNAALTNYAFRWGWIDRMEHARCLRLWRKKRISAGYLADRVRINRKVLAKAAPQLTPASAAVGG
jgi:hypothetical protein